MMCSFTHFYPKDSFKVCSQVFADFLFFLFRMSDRLINAGRHVTFLAEVKILG